MERGIMKYYLCLDVGGTIIKVGLLDEHANLKDQISSYDSCSGEDGVRILENFKFIIKEQFLNLPSAAVISHISFAFPGPFDYKNGISKIQGLDKYDSIYGISIKDFIHSCYPNIPISFCNDVEAFAVGEYYAQKKLSPLANKPVKSLAVCIGTGCGSCFLIDGKAVGKEEYGVPENSWIYPLSFLSGTIDDYLSKRGILRISEDIIGTKIDGKMLSLLVVKGDKKALQCFKEFGKLLSMALTPIVEQFQPQFLMLGGAVMQSSSYFISELKSNCEAMRCQLLVSQNTSLTAMQGLVYRIQSMQNS